MTWREYLKWWIYKAKRPFHFIKTGLLEALPAMIQFGWPQRRLRLYFVSGTDGKTTTATLLYHILRQADHRVGLISTVAAYWDDELVDTGFHVTSPTPRQLYQLLRQMVDRGLQEVVIEITSHGEYQYRTWGLRPAVVGITNVAHEHTDYHVKRAEYLRVKCLIARRGRLAFLPSSLKTERLQVPLPKSVVWYEETTMNSQVKEAVKKMYAQTYNQLNARLAIQMALTSNVSDQQIIKALRSFQGVTGRLESIPNNLGVHAYVDFAHTPQALEAVLKALRQQHPQGKLISVYGCAGLRDRAKRPMMGEIGVRLSDLAVMTAEDPRTENVWTIIRQMKEQLTDQHQKIASIADRAEAIKFAVQQAKSGDVVVVCGKGHEQSMCFGTTEIPWDDRAALRAALKTK